MTAEGDDPALVLRVDHSTRRGDLNSNEYPAVLGSCLISFVGSRTVDVASLKLSEHSFEQNPKDATVADHHCRSKLSN